MPLAQTQELNHALTGGPVHFPVSSVEHLFSNYTFCSAKAIRNLGDQITPLEAALTETIHFLRTLTHG